MRSNFFTILQVTSSQSLESLFKRDASLIRSLLRKSINSQVWLKFKRILIRSTDAWFNNHNGKLSYYSEIARITRYIRMIIFFSFLLILWSYHSALSTKIQNKRTKNKMKLTCFGHSLLREAFCHVYSSVKMRLVGSASKVVGRIGRILYHLQEIVGIKSPSFKFQVSLRFR